MSPNVLGAEKLAYAGSFGPATVNTGAPGQSSVVDMSKFQQATFVVSVGAVAAGQDVVVTVNEGQGSGMTGAKQVRQETLSADASNTQRYFSVRAESLDTNNGFNHLRADITHSDGTGGPIQVAILGSDGRYEPMNQWSQTSATATVP